ncbi:hypothetical protein EDD18DRAFT_1106040 [Armillaria luteobubalina]|uniref:Uncharacterized protein n=1 Tax=Armillaria luteobubalina TaxID=153913 RepID=A0AA39Q4L2_9AGAR|nr:hypothetical protein EDD18DRAFT_1106040 [Armillaria luteobubalina]
MLLIAFDKRVPHFLVTFSIWVPPFIPARRADLGLYIVRINNSEAIRLGVSPLLEKTAAVYSPDQHVNNGPCVEELDEDIHARTGIYFWQRQRKGPCALHSPVNLGTIFNILAYHGQRNLFLQTIWMGLTKGLSVLFNKAYLLPGQSKTQSMIHVDGN